MRCLKWILYSSIFAALCAVALSMSTEYLILGTFPPCFSVLHLFIFSSTLIIYNIHYFKKKLNPGISDRADWSQKNKNTHLFLLILSTISLLVSLFFLSFKVVLASAVLALLSFAYSFPIFPFLKRKKLKEYGLLKIVLLSLVWTLVTVWIPLIYWEVEVENYIAEFFIRFLLMFPLCATFDIRDAGLDKLNNINTLPNKYGLKKTYQIIDISLVALLIANIIQYYRYHIDQRFWAGLLVILLLKFLMKYTKKPLSDVFYLLVIDGMMLFYAILVLL